MSKPLNEPPRATASKGATTIIRASANSAAVRETIESIVIAFVLAFLFRTFEAEAFVIPTGSMAPTLMGRHKDYDCPLCGYRYQVGASEEINQNNGQKKKGSEVIGGVCPMCRFPAHIGPDNPQQQSYPSYGGDRILVGKFAYQFHDPKRWDVAVFRYPGDAETNYIKRLVGLPGETVRIQYGDIHTSQDGESFSVRQKPPHKLLAMVQPVFDNDYIAKLNPFDLPPRWAAEAPADPGAWQVAADATSYETDGSHKGEAWLRYRHLTLTPDQWNDVSRYGKPSASNPIRAWLIDDYTAYNSGGTRDGPIRFPYVAQMEPRHWVGDLVVEASVDVRSDSGTLLFELIKGGRAFHCAIDVATGNAQLSIAGLSESEYGPKATTRLRGPGRYDVRFANCDGQLRLWIDNSLVTFPGGDEATIYGDLRNNTPQQADLEPVSLGSDGAAVKVSHLEIMRDLYYIARPEQGSDESATMEGLRDPSKWRSGILDSLYSDFRLEADQFLALGDNSPKSKDSRWWRKERDEGNGRPDYFVRRELLIGKAEYIYWPHSWNWPVPFWPNVGRMGFIR